MLIWYFHNQTEISATVNILAMLSTLKGFLKSKENACLFLPAIGLPIAQWEIL